MITSFSRTLKEKISPYLPRERKKRKLSAGEFEKYQTDPIAYSQEELGLTPWAGRETKGQHELFLDIGDSVRRQLAGEANVPKIFRVEAGHGVGKTFGAAMLVNWFFDCFAPSVTMTTAPTKNQVEELLWKDIKAIRPSHLKGRVLPGTPRMTKAENWWAKGSTTNNSGGKGSERFQGQHNEYFFVVLDEAEGVPDFVFDATFAMMTGCRVCIVLMLANPRTRASRFFKTGKRPGVMNYRLSVLDHPNVLDGKDTVKGATSREWVIQAVQDWCEVVDAPDVDNYTFTLPYAIPAPVETSGAHGPAGTLFLPNAEFLFRVMGVAPANLANASFVSPGRYENAQKNPPLEGEDKRARIGVDCARYGTDNGTVYVRHAGKCWRAATISGTQIEQQGGLIYYTTVKKIALELAEKGVESLHIRVDGTGGFGSTAIDNLKADAELKAAFSDFKVIEIHFASSARNAAKYANIITECYAEAAETLKRLRIERVPEELEGDLTERLYQPVNKAGVTVIALEEKDRFRKRMEPHRSPDDGDGFVLAVAPDHILNLSWAHDPEAWKMLAEQQQASESKPKPVSWTQAQ